MAFPEKIKMSGLPFMLQGWNNVFHKTNETSEECPIYELKMYVLYGTIDIIGMYIYKQNGIWRARRACDEYSLFEKLGFDQSDPFGNWGLNGYVSSISNDQYVRSWLPNFLIF